MLWMLFMSVAAHHGEAADPTLLAWIKNRIHELFNLGPWSAVILMGVIIAAIPLSVGGFYLFHRRREATPASG